MSDPFPAQLLVALRDLQSWLSHERIDYATIGGVAVSLVAQPRFTNDIDAVVWVDAAEWRPFLESGVQYGFVSRIPDPIEFAARSRVLLLRHSNTGIGLDLSFAALPFEREMIDEAIAIRIQEVSLRIARPEDLIVMKAVANRTKDLADIESILSTNPKLDLARVRRWVKEFADVLEAPEIATNLERILKASSRQT